MGLLAATTVCGVVAAIVIVIAVARQNRPKPPAPVATRTEDQRRFQAPQPTVVPPVSMQHGSPNGPFPSSVAGKDDTGKAAERPIRTPPQKLVHKAPDEPENPNKSGAKDEPSSKEGVVVADPALPEAVPGQQSTDNAKAGKPSKDQREKEPDLPDVALEIPEDIRPAVRAFIKETVMKLRSNIVSDRVKAAEVLGELKEQGKPVRELLCRAMLDPNNKVRVAAADALKNIDAKMQYLAVGLLTDQRIEVLGKLPQLGDDGQPLTPLVFQCATESATKRDYRSLPLAVTALSHIAKNNYAAYKLLASALTNESAIVRASAIRALPRMKHGNQAVPSLLKLLKTDPANLAVTINTLVALADKSTEERIAEAITGFRYHNDEKVRRAVEEGLNKLQNKKDS